MTGLLKRIDTLILNRFLGIPLFLLMMYLTFLCAIQLGAPLQTIFDELSQFIFMNKVEQGLIAINAPQWLIAILAKGVGQGINTTFTFIPVMSILFFCLAFLESSGIMTRIAFVMDKAMQLCGLPGKSFVPMVIGFGCNVPAIMSTKTLENRRERILTIMMSPFMACGARLSIFVLFVAAFFPENGQNVIFELYLIGIIAAVLTGLALKKTILLKPSSAFIAELPPYRWPKFKTLCRSTWHRSYSFVRKAGFIIIPVCAAMGFLGGVNIDTTRISYIETVGKAMTPLFAPMGIQEDNWPATVSLLTGMLAKEVVVGTLNTLYTGYTEESDETHMSASTMGIMVQKFGSPKAAFAYLLFVLLYFPCISVVAVMAKELNKKWALFSVVWTTGSAYTIAVLFYQAATFAEHPGRSFLWIAGLLGMLWGCFRGLRYFSTTFLSLGIKKRHPLSIPICVVE